MTVAPIAYPISWLLDFALGAHERHTYKKAELKSLLQFHSTGAEPLRDDEISILNGVLELGSKRIETIMTPLEVSFCYLAVSVSLGWREAEGRRTANVSPVSGASPLRSADAVSYSTLCC